MTTKLLNASPADRPEERLSRTAIASGAYRDKFGHLPSSLLWSAEQIGRSLADTLAGNPADGDIWVFAYGSLIWNPQLEFIERRTATLHGWQRSFCLRMLAARATPEAPGRMLALVPGGATHGIALRIAAERVQEELPLMWTREMVTGAYRPIWAQVQLDDGTQAWAIVFTADPERPQYQPDASVAAVAPLIAAARGALGSNADYVFRLAAALRELGARDAYVFALEAELRRLSQP